MRGDFTRDTFDARKHFSRVLRQQGRVELDADWNEQTAILLHYIRTLARDVFGVHAGPAAALGFGCITPSMSSAERAQKLAQLESSEQRRKKLLDAVTENKDLIITPGRYYVDGLMVECERPILYTEQLGYPFNQKTSLEALTESDEALLVYLDVWERHVTFVDDDSIRESALGGPDTCSRAQVVWQVKVLPESEHVGSGVFNCSAARNLPGLGSGRLRARVRPQPPSTDLCVVPPDSRYRGAENQLYRVEIHHAGQAASSNGATFKWSRDNGSIVFEIASLTGSIATLRHLGRDQRSSLEPGDWVEIVDDGVAFGEAAGVLVEVDVVDRDNFEVTLKAPTGTVIPSYTASNARAKHAYLRRWDHVGDAKLAGALPVSEQPDADSGFIELEDGIEIAFAKGGKYRAGDFWLIPARTATGNVEWPVETGSDGAPLLDEDGNTTSIARGPNGPRHHFAPLVLFRRTRGQQSSVADCRCSISTLRCGYSYAYSGFAIGADNL